MLPGGTATTSSSPLLAGFCAFGVTSAPGTAGLGWCCHLDFGAQTQLRVVVPCSSTSPSRAPVGSAKAWMEPRPCPMEQGAAGARGTMLPRTSSSINTSKRVLTAASKQEGTERQTRLLATVGGEKQLSLQAGEGLLPAQLRPRGEMSQMRQMGQMGQKGLGPPAPNAVGGLNPASGGCRACGCPCASFCPCIPGQCAQRSEQSGFGKTAGDGAEWDGGSTESCRLLPHPLLPQCRGRFPGLPDRAAPGSLMGLGASLPGHPILILLGGEKSGWDKRH